MDMSELTLLAPETQRSQWLGGSDIAAVMGISPWTTPMGLYEKKTAPAAETKVRNKGALRRGQRWESVVAEMLVERLEEEGHTVEIVASNRRYQDTEHGFMASEIDFELRLDGEPEIWNAELKTVHPFKTKEWGESGTDDLPIHYTAQVMWGMGVTRRRKGMLAALFGADELRTYPVMGDDETIAALRAHGLAFWNNHVLARVPPPPIDLADVARMYAKQSDVPALLADADLTSKVLRLRALQQQSKACEAEAESLEFDIKRAMGECGELILPNGKKALDWKHRSGKYLDETGLKEAHPSIAKEFTRTWESRVFSLKAFDTKGL